VSFIEQNYGNTCRRLQEWADFNRDPFNLGFKSASTTARAFEGNGSGGIATKETPIEVQEVDDALKLLRLFQQQQFYAVRYYFESNSISWMFRKAGFKNRHKARESLNAGVAWIDAKITR